MNSRLIPLVAVPPRIFLGRQIGSWTLAAGLYIGAQLCSAASTNPPAPARRSPAPPVISPDRHPDDRVTFRLRAPKAQEVSIQGQWGGGRTNLTKDTNEVWSVTLGPIAPGIYEYSFTVDGLTMIDPGNSAIKPMREPRTSILHLPGTPPRLHDFRDLPHGCVREHAYASRSLGRLRQFMVYTPPGYDQQVEARFPVLFLQHGMGDNQATWTVHGKAHWILDNLIADGTARPMLVVMMDGHAVLPGGGGAAFESNTTAFERDLIEDVVPFIDAQYRVKPGPENRAIVGLSMGGGQSLTIGLRHPDRFAWVGGFSSATPGADAIPNALANAASINERLRLLWIACGKSDFLLSRNESFIATLKEKGLRHEWHLTDGDHSWPVWRGYLAEFAPRLFR
jgi:enterochelin esterase family protein